MPAGQTLPLYVQSFDYDATRYPQAVLRDDAGNLIGSPINLSPIGALGLYGNLTVRYPSGPKFITAQYIFYDDSGYTQVSTGQGADLDTFF